VGERSLKLAGDDPGDAWHLVRQRRIEDDIALGRPIAELHQAQSAATRAAVERQECDVLVDVLREEDRHLRVAVALLLAFVDLHRAGQRVVGESRAEDRGVLDELVVREFDHHEREHVVRAELDRVEAADTVTAVKNGR